VQTISPPFSTMKKLTILVVLLLQGCAVPIIVSMGIGAASVAVNETTGKTVTDHVVSTVNGKDCKVSRAMDHKDMCQDEVVETPKVVAEKPIVIRVTATSSVDDMERVLAQRRAQK